MISQEAPGPNPARGVNLGKSIWRGVTCGGGQLEWCTSLHTMGTEGGPCGETGVGEDAWWPVNVSQGGNLRESLLSDQEAERGTGDYHTERRPG